MERSARTMHCSVAMVPSCYVSRCVSCMKVTKEEYTRVGSKKLGQQLEQQLKEQGRKPYVIPVGGSDSVGTFGYLAATQELLEQAGKGAFTDIINVGIIFNMLLKPQEQPHILFVAAWTMTGDSLPLRRY